MRWVEGGDRGGVPWVCVVVGFWGEGGVRSTLKSDVLMGLTNHTL